MNRTPTRTLCRTNLQFVHNFPETPLWGKVEKSTFPHKLRENAMSDMYLETTYYRTWIGKKNAPIWHGGHKKNTLFHISPNIGAPRASRASHACEACAAFALLPAGLRPAGAAPAAHASSGSSAALFGCFQSNTKSKKSQAVQKPASQSRFPFGKSKGSAPPAAPPLTFPNPEARTAPPKANG